MAGKYDIDRGAYDLKRRVSKLAFRKNRCVPAGVQQSIAVAQGDLQSLRKAQEHLTARLRTASFEKGQVPG